VSPTPNTNLVQSFELAEVSRVPLRRPRALTQRKGRYREDRRAFAAAVTKSPAQSRSSPSMLGEGQVRGRPRRTTPTTRVASPSAAQGGGGGGGCGGTGRERNARGTETDVASCRTCFETRCRSVRRRRRAALPRSNGSVLFPASWRVFPPVRRRPPSSSLRPAAFSSGRCRCCCSCCCCCFCCRCCCCRCCCRCSYPLFILHLSSPPAAPLLLASSLSGHLRASTRSRCAFNSPLVLAFLVHNEGGKR
jgi:hypothetical protein